MPSAASVAPVGDADIHREKRIAALTRVAGRDLHSLWHVYDMTSAKLSSVVSVSPHTAAPPLAATIVMAVMIYERLYHVAARLIQDTKIGASATPLPINAKEPDAPDLGRINAPDIPNLLGSDFSKSVDDMCSGIGKKVIGSTALY